MKTVTMSEDTKPKQPNLFDFATKELSQDAMICWLIRWADFRFANTDRELPRLWARVRSGIATQAWR